MRKNILFILLLLLSPNLALADKGKSKKWWSTPLIVILYIGFFLIAAGVALCIRHFRDRGRNLDYQEQDAAANRGMDATEIESLPSLRFSEMKMHRLAEEDQQLECAVCLSEFKDQEVLRLLPGCFHVFHPQCIAPWLASHITCPTCRSSLDHRQGSSMSRSSIFDGISSRFSQRFDGLSGPLSQRFDGISGPLSQIFDHNNNHDDDHNHDDHTIVEIEESSTSQSQVNLESSPVLNSSMGRLPYYRSYSTGDLMIYMAPQNSSTLSSSLPKESSPKSNYRTSLSSYPIYLAHSKLWSGSGEGRTAATHIHKEEHEQIVPGSRKNQSNYRTIHNKQQDNWSSISSKSDRFVDYSSLS